MRDRGLRSGPSRWRVSLWGSVLLTALVPTLVSLRADAGDGPAAVATAAGSGIIHMEVDLQASPERVYQTLLDAKGFAAATGGLPTEIASEVGGAFSCFGGQIVGRHVELVPTRRIVQAWRVAAWPEGLYSIAKFELKPQGTGTRVLFDHTGFPPEQKEHLAAGWEDHYWKGLRTLR